MLARQPRRRDAIMLAARHGGTNPWLCTHNANLARFTGSDGVDNLRDERTEIVEPIAMCADQHNANGVRGKVLLELQVLVHSDENLKLADRLPQERAVLQAGPAEPDDGLCVECCQV